MSVFSSHTGLIAGISFAAALLAPEPSRSQSNPSPLPYELRGKIDAGEAHTVAITSAGVLWTWGNNTHGQLGDGTTTNRSTPQHIIFGPFTGTRFKAVSASNHSAGIDTSNRLWCWGLNATGQVGDGTTVNRPKPRVIKLGTANIQARSVACGLTHTVAADTSGGLWAWGSNSDGQIGNGTLVSSPVPVPVSKPVGMGLIIQVAAGDRCSYALDNTGKIWAWGDNTNGRLGDNTTTDRAIPVQVYGTLPSFRSVSAKHSHVAALGVDDSIWTWGNNANGRLGLGHTVSRSSPNRVTSGIAMARNLKAGFAHTLAESESHNAWSWGLNSNGQLGNGNQTQSTVPIQVYAWNGVTDVVDLAAGGSHSSVLKHGGTMAAWGNRVDGRLGAGTTSGNQTTPVWLTNTLTLGADNGDGDLMPDSWEKFYFGSTGRSNTSDWDSDGLLDRLEYVHGTHPKLADTDGDGAPDGYEISNGMPPLDATNMASADDWDGDGLPDVWELANGLDPYDTTGINGAAGDPDGDGVTNLAEYQGGASPQDEDDFPVQIVSLWKQSWAFNGTIQWWGWDESQYGEESYSGEVTPSMLVAKVGTYAFPSVPTVGMPNLVSLNWNSPNFTPTNSAVSRFTHISSPYGNADQMRIWIRAPMKNFARKFSVIKVADNSLHVGGVGVNPAIRTIESTVVVEFTIPANADFSNHVDLAPVPVSTQGAVNITTVSLLPVGVKVNDTDSKEDDLVAVSKGTDEDLATDFSVKVSGMDGLTAELSVKGDDGEIKFKDQTLTLANGVETNTKLWGIAPSSDKDKTIIEITLKKDGNELGKIDEKVTVFKGAKLEFEGNFYINVDTREFARRPWDGRADPKPNSAGDMTGNTTSMTAAIGASPTAAELAAFKKAVDQCFSFGYESAISFKDGDNPSIPNYKPWKDNLEVKVTKVMAKQPSFEIANDQMNNALISLKKGHLEGPDANETLVDPEIAIAEFLTLENATSNTNISYKDNVGQTVTAAQVATQIAAARGGNHEELLDYLAGKTGPLAGFSGLRFDWKNDTFEVKKEAKIKDSFAAKAIKGEKENGEKVEVKWLFTKWNEFKFQGDLDEAVIETK